jgi:holo-[acyl-carrier protein] synthase
VGDVVGVGIDVVDVQRFAAVISRRPRVLDRLFTDAERVAAGDRPERLAARFAAKEAVAKALGDRRLSWRDAEVATEAGGRPRLIVRGGVARAAERQGVRDWQLSLAHDGGCAVAIVLALR